MLQAQRFIGLPKSELLTPALVIDRKLLQQNLLTMQAFAKAAKKNLRPHVKTHKCSKLAKLQLQTGSIGISCAKVSEALALIENNVRHILITSPVTHPTKIALLIKCLEDDPDLIVVVDNLENADDLNAFAKQQDHRLNILIDLDPDLGRTGIKLSETINFAKKLQTFPYLNLRGIQCYCGNLQHIPSFEQRREKTLHTMRKAATVFNELKQAGFALDIFTGGGTGTYDIDSEIPEMTEIQPGSYTVMDADYFRLQSKHDQHFTAFKPAMTLLANVISHNHVDHVTIDAGLKALYYDATPPLVINPASQGLIYEWGYGDEHGKLLNPQHAPLPLNSMIELMVAHCDPTINLFDHFFVTHDNVVIDVWPIDLRGKSQ